MKIKRCIEECPFFLTSPNKMEYNFQEILQSDVQNTQEWGQRVGDP